MHGSIVLYPIKNPAEAGFSQRSKRSVSTGANDFDLDATVLRLARGGGVRRDRLLRAARWSGREDEARDLMDDLTAMATRGPGRHHPNHRAVAPALLVVLAVLSLTACGPDSDSPSLSQCVQDGGLGC